MSTLVTGIYSWIDDCRMECMNIMFKAGIPKTLLHCVGVIPVPDARLHDGISSSSQFIIIVYM